MIRVGAATEIEMKEKKARVEDAMHATRAAVEEGIVPGGGVALIRAAQRARRSEGCDDEEQVGVQIVRRAVEEPLRWIAQNAGVGRLRRPRQGAERQGRVTASTRPPRSSKI